MPRKPPPSPMPPGPGQESVWDYPRPPRLERCEREIVIVAMGRELVRTTGAYRVLETSHPPTYYLPLADVDQSVLQPGRGGSFCEWKGAAKYWSVAADGRVLENVGWGYPSPTAAFADLVDCIAFYAGPMDRCTVGGQEVTPQPGGFYGGWVTPDVVGPFKGEPGTEWW